MVLEYMREVLLGREGCVGVHQRCHVGWRGHGDGQHKLGRGSGVHRRCYAGQEGYGMAQVKNGAWGHGMYKACCASGKCAVWQCGLIRMEGYREWHEVRDVMQEGIAWVCERCLEMLGRVQELLCRLGMRHRGWHRSGCVGVP